MKTRVASILTVALLTPSALWAGEVISKAPIEPDPDTHYVFYLHGQIVQDSGPTPTHPRWGLYDYPLIIETLARGDITVVSERRKAGTDRTAYSKIIANQVTSLLSAGVSARNVTVVGFSAGGVIAIQTSSQLVDADISFVFLAACSEWMNSATEIRLHGHVLSVFEESDATYSCKELADRPPGPTSFDEFSINTGKEHGAFYLPVDAWVQPVLEWIQR